MKYINRNCSPAYKQQKSGFTIIEMLIVVVVIGILGGIGIIAYGAIQGKARGATLRTDLQNAAKEMEISKVRGQAGFPSELPSRVKTSDGNVLQLATVGDSTAEYCINGYDKTGSRLSIRSGDGLKDYLCSGLATGNPVGGTVPEAPRGQNLVADFSQWTLSGDVSYDPASKEIRFGTGSGYVDSPQVRVDGARSAKFTADSYATKPSPLGTPNSRTYWSSMYYDANGNSVQSTSGYSGNGNAQTLPLNAWTSISWTTTTGPPVVYVRFRLNVSPSNYTSDNRHRNPQITAVD